MKKTLNFLLSLAIISALAVPTSAKTFTDVKDDETYKVGIEFLAEIGIVNGHPDGSYKPLETLNRAEMLKIIAEGSLKNNGQETTVFDDYNNKKCFNDVITGAWYTKYICYGKDKGWVVGYENGKFFKPDQKVSFVEALKMSYKAFGMEFNESPDPWFKDLVVAASERNYIPHTISAFHTPLQRNQMADMVTRMVKYDMGSAELEMYLGARADVVVTYETIEKGQDLSKLEVKVINKGGEVSVNEEIAKVKLKAVNNSDKWVEILIANDGEVKAEIESSDAVFLAEKNGKFYYINSPECNKETCTDSEKQQWSAEVDMIGKNFIAGGVANGNNVYTNTSHQFSLNFPESWGSVTDSSSSTVVKIDTNSNKTYTVKMTAQGFSPSALSIKAGDTVKFLNDDTVNHWPASDEHPSHSNYPGSSISLCGQQHSIPIFDACTPIEPNKSFDFTFDAKGTWGFHDHINTSFQGEVKVE